VERKRAVKERQINIVIQKIIKNRIQHEKKLTIRN
jgi:hypothetical protein